MMFNLLGANARRPVSVCARRHVAKAPSATFHLSSHGKPRKSFRLQKRLTPAVSPASFKTPEQEEEGAKPAATTMATTEKSQEGALLFLVTNAWLILLLTMLFTSLLYHWIIPTWQAGRFDNPSVLEVVGYLSLAASFRKFHDIKLTVSAALLFPANVADAVAGIKIVQTRLGTLESNLISFKRETTRRLGTLESFMKQQAKMNTRLEAAIKRQAAAIKRQTAAIAYLTTKRFISF